MKKITMFQRKGVRKNAYIYYHNPFSSYDYVDRRLYP